MMKKSILTLLFFIISFLCFSQNISGIVYPVNLNYEQVSSDQFDFIFETSFTMGSPGNCIPVVNNEMFIENDTLNIKIYYDIRGVWQEMGCQRVDHFFYEQIIPSNTTTIKMSINVISYDENNLEDPNAYIVVNDFETRYFTLNLAVNDHIHENISIYPNPLKDRLYYEGISNVSKIIIYNALGQYWEMKSINNMIDMSVLPSGFYLFNFIDEKNKIIATKKIIKQ